MSLPEVALIPPPPIPAPSPYAQFPPVLYPPYIAIVPVPPIVIPSKLPPVISTLLV